MLKASFSCFNGVGRAAEIKIWESGCLSWDQFAYLPQGTFSADKTTQIVKDIDCAQKALAAGLPDYFLNRFAVDSMLRAYPDFSERSAIIDIETTGLTRKDTITSIAVLRSGKINVYVKGINLSDFLGELSDVDLILTFNGTRFDLPFLRRHFSIDLAIPHLDLMLILRAFGYRGGQKVCERQFKLHRRYSDGESGREAVVYWEKWCGGDVDSLRNLVLYNAEDVAMLEKLAVRLYSLTMARYPLNLSLKPSLKDDSSVKDAFDQLDL